MSINTYQLRIYAFQEDRLFTSWKGFCFNEWCSFLKIKISSQITVFLFNDKMNTHSFENFLSAVIFVLLFMVALMLQFFKNKLLIHHMYANQLEKKKKWHPLLLW